MATEKTAEEAAEIKAARASIKVDTGVAIKTDEEKAAAKEADAAAELKEANEAAEAEAKAAEEANKTEAEKSEEKIEELEAAKEEAKTIQEKDKFQKRIDRETAKRKALENEIKELKAKLAVDPNKENALTEEEVEKRAEQKAQAKQIKREFDQATDRLFKQAVKADKDFQGKINALADDIGLIPGHLIGILDDLDNGGDILVHFTANPDEAEEIYQMSPARAAVKLAKLSTKLEAEKKPALKPISQVPDPTESIKGGNSNPDVLPKDPTKHMDQFVRIRAKQVEERRKAKMGLH